MKQAVKVLAVSLGLTLMVGCSKLGGGQTVAEVNGQPITKAQFDDTFNRSLTLMHIKPEMLKNSESNPLVLMMKRSVLSDLILDALVQQEAAKRHIEAKQSEVDSLYNKLSASPQTHKAIEEGIKSGALTEGLLKDELRKQILRNQLATELEGNSVKVTDAEAKAFYEKNAQLFDQPEQVDARQILIMANKQQLTQEVKEKDKNASADTITKDVDTLYNSKKNDAQAILNQVKANPQSFADVAKAKSDDKASAVNGGDLGFFTRKTMVPTFADAAFSGKPGQIVDKVVESPYGFHIIQVVDRKPAEKKSFEQVKSQLIVDLQMQQKQKFLQEWALDERKKAKVTINPKYDFDNQMQSAGGAPGGFPVSPAPQQAKPKS